MATIALINITPLIAPWTLLSGTCVHRCVVGQRHGMQLFEDKKKPSASLFTAVYMRPNTLLGQQKIMTVVHSIELGSRTDEMSVNCSYPGARFTDKFSTTSQMWGKFLGQIRVNRSLDILYMARQLYCRMSSCVTSNCGEHWNALCTESMRWIYMISAPFKTTLDVYLYWYMWSSIGIYLFRSDVIMEGT